MAMNSNQQYVVTLFSLAFSIRAAFAFGRNSQCKENKRKTFVNGLPQMKTLLQGYMESVFMISQTTFFQICALTIWDMILGIR